MSEAMQVNGISVDDNTVTVTDDEKRLLLLSSTTFAIPITSADARHLASELIKAANRLDKRLEKKE